MAKSIASQVNAIVKSVYEPYANYNDRLQNSRKLKYMRNGYMYSKGTYTKWTNQIVAKLKEAGIEFISAKFEDCDRPGYGPYKAFVVRIKEDPKPQPDLPGRL